ncbi:peroxisomal multifunctional enzyme type 2 isoform X1 [Schistocerca cancellata]|uniref:peroxisomal multifunctional enzyme type 2 isoform X1 n=2 Tax=Schistocerca cancellata TaxID=274614 RepID=UPI002118E78C|nr:peroxisomal multifunctional enzyme type 2 isoform X1 [Schistocerca cancellata]
MLKVLRRQLHTFPVMADKLRFDGRVAVVTGAGAGLGRAYALLFAERGASVVVNDLGGGRHGEGQSTNAADSVVQEIKRKGGVAVADYNSVEDGHKIIDTALNNFGRVDIVVNNAGILRDKSFARISDTDWDLIQRVHLKGTFKTTQAAWPHFRKQNYGRIIVTASNSGLYGNFGQANYSAAKMAVVGLSNTLAIEGRKYNIHCNVIAPTAASRLTEDILPPDFFAELRPELIAPVVVWLCHEECEETGSIIESAAGWAGKCHLVRGKGVILRQKLTDDVILETVRDKWPEVIDMSGAERLESIQEASGSLMTALEEMKAGGAVPTGQKSVSGQYSYTNRDLILYALGIGATVTDPSDLKYLYELHEDFAAIPSFWILPGQVAMMGSGLIGDVVPGKEVDFSKVLHGEQYLEVLKPISTSGNLKSVAYVADVLDKGSGAVILVNIESFDESGEKVAQGQMVVFAVGCGGFGGKRSSDKQIPALSHPNRSPDASLSQKTIEDQAALYRLSGDYNPLHIDPNMAALGGFDRPILHGLCSLGFSVRHVLKRFANNDASKFKSVKARFSKPVIPGQTLRTDMWQQGNRIFFETSVVETGSPVISGAYIDLVETQNVYPNRVSAKALKSEEVFDEIEKRMMANLDKAKKINGVFLYKITQNGQEAASWTIDLKKGKLYKGDPQGTKADCTITIEDQDLVDMAKGTLNPQVAFMKGKLKVKGNIMLMQKLRSLTTEESKL